VVEGDPGIAQKFQERGSLCCQARKDEAAIAGHASGRLHRAVRVVHRHARTVIPVGQGNALDAPIQVKGPCVITATEGRAGVSLSVAADLYTAMGAAVVEHTNLIIEAPDHDHRLPADLNGDVVTGLLQL